MLTLLSTATIVGIGAFLAGLVGFFANLFQVREGLGRMLGGGTSPVPGPNITNIFQSRGSIKAAAIGGAIGAGGAVVVEEILRNADLLQHATSVVGDVGSQIPDIPAIDGILSAGGDALSSLSDLFN
ncbi:MAG: hypothetical protein ABI036_07240 [Fibrobacteria bacterium]